MTDSWYNSDNRKHETADACDAAVSLEERPDVLTRRTRPMGNDTPIPDSSVNAQPTNEDCSLVAEQMLERHRHEARGILHWLADDFGKFGGRNGASVEMLTEEMGLCMRATLAAAIYLRDRGVVEVK